MNQVQTVVNYWMVNTSYSVGVSDTVADASTINTIQATLDEAKKKVDAIMARGQQGLLEMQPGKPLMESFEMNINEVLNDARSSVGKRAQTSLKGEIYCAVLCCAVLCCAVLCCAVLCCAVLCNAVLCCYAMPPPAFTLISSNNYPPSLFLSFPLFLTMYVLDRNAIKGTVMAGSKGSELNISQIIACVGQQNVQGKRIRYGFTQRTLPHFSKDDLGMESRGFVENR